MADFKFGNIVISDAKLGASQVSKIYHGSILIWPIDGVAPTAPVLDALPQYVNGVTLTWAAATDNVGVVEYRVYRNGSGTAIATGITGLTWSDLSVTPDTSYSYTVRAYDAAGNASPLSNSISTVVDANVPTKPVVTVTGTTSTTISISWTSTDASSGIDYFYVGISPGGTVTVQENVSTYTYTGLTPNTQYYIRVRAVDNLGNTGSFSDDLYHTTSQAVDAIPSNVATGGTSNYTTTSIDLNWGAATDDNGIAGYNFFDTAYAAWFTTTGVGTTHTRTGLSPGTLYTFHIKARDTAGQLSAAYYNLGAVWTLCIAPTLTYVSQTSTSITISRNTVTGADSYSLYWKVAGGSYALATSAMGTSYTKTGLTTGNTYLFYAVANNPATHPSADSNIITQIIDGTAPSTPQNTRFENADFGLY